MNQDLQMKLIIAELLILNGYETVDEQALNILEEMISLWIGIKNISNLGGKNDSNMLDVFSYMDLNNMDYTDFKGYLNQIKERNDKPSDLLQEEQENQSQIQQIETMKQNKVQLKEYCDHLPVFPQKFSYKFSDVKPKINFTEIQIKEIKCSQKKQTDEDISSMKEIGIEHSNVQYQQSLNPFEQTKKKVKTINLDEF